MVSKEVSALLIHKSCNPLKINGFCSQVQVAVRQITLPKLSVEVWQSLKYSTTKRKKSFHTKFWKLLTCPHSCRVIGGDENLLATPTEKPKKVKRLVLLMKEDTLITAGWWEKDVSRHFNWPQARRRSRQEWQASPYIHWWGRRHSSFKCLGTHICTCALYLDLKYSLSTVT